MNGVSKNSFEAETQLIYLTEEAEEVKSIVMSEMTRQTFHYDVQTNDYDYLSISPTFYEQLLRKFPCAKKVQT